MSVTRSISEKMQIANEARAIRMRNAWVVAKSLGLKRLTKAYFGVQTTPTTMELKNHVHVKPTAINAVEAIRRGGKWKARIAVSGLPTGITTEQIKLHNPNHDLYQFVETIQYPSKSAGMCEAIVYKHKDARKYVRKIGNYGQLFEFYAFSLEEAEKHFKKMEIFCIEEEWGNTVPTITESYKTYDVDSFAPPLSIRFNRADYLYVSQSVEEKTEWYRENFSDCSRKYYRVTCNFRHEKTKLFGDVYHFHECFLP